MHEQENSAPWRARRDSKLAKMLDPEEPAWLVEESVDLANDMVSFAVVHRWKPGGWARRRYSYDVVSDVMHFRGTIPLGDNEITRMKPEHLIAREVPPAPR